MSKKSKIVIFLLLLLSVGYSHAQCSPDTVDPLIVSPPDLDLANDTGECFATLTAAQLSYPTTYDACGVISTLPSNIPANYEFPVGTTVVTWTATDAAGNSGTATQTVTITDQEAPVVNCPATINVTTNPGDCDAYVNVVATASDNCYVSSVSNDNTSGGLDASGTYPIGTTTVSYTVTDSAGLTASCSVDVNVVNADSPTITLTGPSSITLEACDTYNELGATATDTCLGDISSNLTIDTSGLNTAAVGTYDVIYTVINAAGIPSSPVIRTVTVVDTTPPSLTLIGPGTLTIGNCSTYTELGAESIDPCFGDISGNVVVNNSSVDTSTLGTYTVTYSVVDNNGNSGGSITRTVEVIDNTPPDIVLLGDNPQVLESCAGYTELGATAIDPCFGTDFSGSLVIDTSAVDFSVVGSYQVTYNVTDTYGNAAIEVIRDIEIVDTTPPTITLLGDNPQIVSACTPYSELGATAIDPCSGVDYTSSIIIDDSALDVNVEGTYQVTYTVCDATGNCAATSIRDVEVVLGNSLADAGNNFTNSVCTDTTISLNANAVIGTNASGLWTVTSGQTTGFSFSDDTSNTSTFTGDIGETYTLTWTIDNPDPCADVSDSITVTFINCSALDFDGADDNITFRNNYNLPSSFTIELWIKSDSQNNNIQTIISKREAFNLTNGYDLRVVDGYVSFNWNNGGSITSPYRINLNQWHHVAVTHSSGSYNLYIDGIEMSSTSGSVPLANGYDCLVGAMYQNTNAPFTPLNYFEGGMDELRIWNTTLTETQIRKMMNQEITDLNPTSNSADGFIYGSEVPLQIVGLNWNALEGYYRMNQNSDLSSGNLVATNAAVSGLLRYMTTLQPETAPLPYISNSNGLWTNNSTWLHGSVQAIPNSMGIDNATKINWNIVRTGHNISSGNNNIILLGLNVDANTLTIENTDVTDGQSLRITDYLLLNGTLKLTGESQLLQDMGSIVDYAGAGMLHRDQQGTSNLYNYNYWGTPVSIDGSTYTVGSIIHQGTQPFLWTSAHNADPNTSPITMSRRWLYLYENYPVNSYADWVGITENYSVTTPLGFLMKGSGASTPTQNYTFIGKPNNGTYTTPITANYEALVGNPYPSAIDAHEFINDNSSSMLGTLYFWEHYVSNDTHVLADYQGGFATYNLTGGNPAVSPPEVSGLGTPLVIPERYIPVAQGFTVEANPTGGVITFENDQRVFVKEGATGAADNGSVFIRNANYQQDSTSDEDPIQRIRLRFVSPEEASRHLLLGFVPNNAADDGYNYGYDAPNTDDLPSDMSWVIEDEYYVIQGVGDFDITKMYPLHIKLAIAGNIQISITDIENFDEAIDVYVYDALNNTSFNINETDFQYNLNAGEYHDRFYLTFQPNTQLSVNETFKEQAAINYIIASQEIQINLLSQLEVQQVQLLNILGQTVYSWQQEQLQSTEGIIKITVPKIAEGSYIIQLKTNEGQTTTKKVVLSY